MLYPCCPVNAPSSLLYTPPHMSTGVDQQMVKPRQVYQIAQRSRGNGDGHIAILHEHSSRRNSMLSSIRVHKRISLGGHIPGGGGCSLWD